MERRVTLDDLRGDSPEINGSFNRLQDEVRAVAKTEEEMQSKMTEIVLKKFICFHRRRTLTGWGMKKRRSRVTRLRKPGAHVTATIRKANCTVRFTDDREEKAKHGRSQKAEEQNGASESRPTATMPIEFQKKILELQGYDVKMVIEKKLTKTDLDPHYCRLSIPKGLLRFWLVDLLSRILPCMEGQMKVEFLTKEDQENLGNTTEDGKHREGMEVLLIEPNLKKSSISLGRWKIGKSTSYILRKTWTKVTDSNQLKADDTIQVWSFRVHGSLGLAIINMMN